MKGVLVLGVQMLLVLSIAAKYAWERHVDPMVWTRATQFDPEHALRGRYLALTLHADACGLPKSGHANFVSLKKDAPLDDDDDDDDAQASDAAHPPQGKKFSNWTWETLPAVKDGVLAPVMAGKSPGDTETLTLGPDLPCEYASLQGSVEYFVGEHAKAPFPLATGEELWALVTVPKVGPPRPVRLGVSDGKGFKVLGLR